MGDIGTGREIPFFEVVQSNGRQGLHVFRIIARSVPRKM
jgi:hypothetical protein